MLHYDVDGRFGELITHGGALGIVGLAWFDVKRGNARTVGEGEDARGVIETFIGSFIGVAAQTVAAPGVGGLPGDRLEVASALAGAEEAVGGGNVDHVVAGDEVVFEQLAHVRAFLRVVLEDQVQELLSGGRNARGKHRRLLAVRNVVQSRELFYQPPKYWVSILAPRRMAREHLENRAPKAPDVRLANA